MVLLCCKRELVALFSIFFAWTQKNVQINGWSWVLCDKQKSVTQRQGFESMREFELICGNYLNN